MTKLDHRALELEHAETFLDVVFGVILALPLIGLPARILAFADGPTHEGFSAIVLSLASLGFCAFYWLETRHFISEQERFDAALLVDKKGPGRVPIPLAGFVLGSLAMMILATATLHYAEQQRPEPFLVASAMFWSADLIGTLSLRRLYQPYRADIHRLRKKRPSEHEWFAGHITSHFFVVYGAVNAAVFTLVLLLDRATDGDERIRVAWSLFILLLIVFRHGYWRNHLYARWISSRDAGVG